MVKGKKTGAAAKNKRPKFDKTFATRVLCGLLAALMCVSLLPGLVLA